MPPMREPERLLFPKISPNAEIACGSSGAPTSVRFPSRRSRCRYVGDLARVPVGRVPGASRTSIADAYAARAAISFRATAAAFADAKSCRYVGFVNANTYPVIAPLVNRCRSFTRRTGWYQLVWAPRGRRSA